MPFFIFNNISSIDMGIIVNKLPPIIKANRDIELIEVPGRDGFITQDLGTYRGIPKAVECSIKDTANIDLISSWLTGSGEVIFSNEDDRKYKAVIKNQIDFNKVLRIFRSFIVQFECHPYKYSLNNEVIIINENNAKIFNSSSISKPIIKVFGSGDVTLMINNKNITLKGIVDNVTLDSEMMDCYKGIELKNNTMTGEFPLLAPGFNNISWVGNITKLEITPNWRWL